MPVRFTPRELLSGDPGRYRDQIRIQQKTVTSQDSFGADVFTWTTLYTGYAAVRQLSGSESAKLQQRWAEVAYEVELQYISGLTEDLRISWWDGATHRTLNVLGIVDPSGQRQRLWIYCKEIKNT